MQYDPKKVTVTVGGFIITAFGEDTFISAERNTEKRTQHPGAQGKIDYTKSADDSGTVTITLKNSSPANAILKRLYNSDETFQFACIDANIDGDIGIAGSECVVQSVPTFERGAELGEREWTLLVSNYEEAFVTDVINL